MGSDQPAPTAASDVKALGMDAAARHRAEAQASNCLARAAELLHQHRSQEALNMAECAVVWIKAGLPDEEAKSG
jgi:hypothetical protein